MAAKRITITMAEEAASKNDPTDQRSHRPSEEKGIEHRKG